MLQEGLLKGLFRNEDDSDDDGSDWFYNSLKGTHTVENPLFAEKEENDDQDDSEDPIEASNNENEQGESFNLLGFPDEILLNIATYLDLGAWNTFIRVCWRLHAVGQDLQAMGHIFLNEVRRSVARGHHTLALVRNWQGIFRMLWVQGTINTEVANQLRPLLTNPGDVRSHIPQALTLLNPEAGALQTLPEPSRHVVHQLWIQGTLLFRAQEEPNSMFIRELVGLCHTMDKEVCTHITVQRLFALLEEFHHPIQAHIAALNALEILFNEGLLSDKEMQNTLTVMLHIITRQEYPQDTRLASGRCIQRLTLGDILSDLRRGCVLKALITDITLRRNSAERRIELIHILDPETLRPILSPRLRGQLIECLPIFIRNADLNNMAHQHIISLMNTGTLTENELVTLANNLRPLVTHADENMRIRMVHLLTEAILNEDLSPTFRNGCAEELKSLLNDGSLLVAEALMESAVRLYEEHTDPFPMTLLYTVAIELVHCPNVLIANIAIEFIRRFHQEQGEEGLIALTS